VIATGNGSSLLCRLRSGILRPLGLPLLDVFRLPERCAELNQPVEGERNAKFGATDFFWIFASRVFIPS
jgi:hypothetical protein